MNVNPSIDTAPVLPSASPAGPIVGRSVWTGADFPDDRSWVHALEPAMADELIDAARAARRLGAVPRALTAADFQLTRSAALLDAMHADIDAGAGFALMSGFPVDELDAETLELAYCGFCAHLGTITVQNREGEYILEVTDKGKAYDRQSRGYHSTAHLDFHNDGTSIVTLLCLSTAAVGGRSMLISGPAVYNAILAEAPEHLPALCRGFHHHRRNQQGPGQGPVTPYRTPVFGFFNGLFHMAYAGPSVLFCEEEGIVVSDEEKAALAFFETVVARPQMQVSMELRKGDLQFVNNFLVLHARTAYRDSERQRRKLLRLWLDDQSSARLGPGKMDWYMEECSRFSRSGGLAGLEHHPV